MVVGKIKVGDDSTTAVRAQAAASPLPQVTIPTTMAPAGKKGPVGTAPRTDYSRVNTGAPSIPDAGAMEQKSLLPKFGSIMTTQAARPTLQTMYKAAQMGTLGRANIAQEAQRQLHAVTKIAEEHCKECKKPMGECTCKKKEASTLTTAYATKLAEALEYMAEEAKVASTAPPAHITEHQQEPGKGPGALAVSQATASTTLPDHKGQGHNVVPMKPGTEKTLPQEHGATSMETNEAHRPGGNAKTPLTTVGKHASVLEANLARLGLKTAGVKEEAPSRDLLTTNLERLGLKVAEDAINPAKISAGKAVAPETSKAGEGGGSPAGGKPQGPSGLVGSNAESIKYTKGQAKAPVKEDLRKWFTEPALTSSTDSTLQKVLDNTGKAGVKISAELIDGQAKTAAARALLATLLPAESA